MDSERIVQITDTHVVADYRQSVLHWDPIIALQGAVASIQSLEVAPKLVIATGDLVHEPSRANYEALRAVLSTIQVPVLVIPGNHDSLEQIDTFLLGGNIALGTQVALAQADWSVVFLDSQVEGEEFGRITQEAIASLENTVANMPQANCLLGMHHSPLPNCRFPTCQLQNNEMLFDFLSVQEKVKLVVSGHTHFSTENKLGGIAFLTTTSTLFQVAHSQETHRKEDIKFMDVHKFDGEKKGYRIIDLHSDGTFSSSEMWI